MSNPLIYICEDDPSLGQAIMARLQHEGYRVCLFDEALSMDEHANEQVPDLLLLDVQLPDETGYSIAQRYLRTVPSLRVIMMSVLGKPHDLMTGYDAGAMLYLPKPFKPEALLACLTGVFGPINKPEQEVDWNLTFNTQTHKLTHKAGVVCLTESESKVLVFLALRSPEAAQYHELMETLGADLDHARKNTLETLMSRLRQKLADIDRSELTIHNQRNYGYSLIGELLIVS